MAEVVGMALLSVVVKMVLEKLASPDVYDLIRGKKLTQGLLRKLKIAVLSVNAVLEDAEEKQLMKPFVKNWIDELKDALYDADDILDQMATEAMRSKLVAEFHTATGKVRSYISTFLERFVNEIEPKIKDVISRVDDLAKQKDLMGLQEIAGRSQSKRLPTTPSFEESRTFGFDDDKKKIIDLLLSDDASRDQSVIAIDGMPGVGKTTLAQFVYSDSTVKKHFSLEVWFCISAEFLVSKVQKSIIEAVTSSPCNSEDPTMVEEQLKGNLLGKKFLIVLDDVWSEDPVHQEFLSKLLQYGVQGSKILITTRHQSVASAMHASATHSPKKLSEDDCWELFAKQAFGDDCSDSRKELEEIGRQIIKKCKGLPLAVKAVGALLWSKLDADEWNKILQSNLWDLPINEKDIKPALRLSYIYLPSHLKQCFAYCSIFPKDSILEKDRIVLLWMAEGFLQPSKFETMEEVGHRYFLDLVSRSLFQQWSEDKSLFGMHDLIHDLAKSVAGQFSFMLKQGDTTNEIVKMTRHFSCSGASLDTFVKFEEALSKVKQLRTFLALDSSSWNSKMFGKNLLHNALPMLSCLRVLSLPHNRDITYLPNSIGKLKHLRYLDLSFTRIKRLPKSTCKLINLQTLKLSGCKHLVALPKHMWKLTSLRQLDIAGTGIKKMPEQLGSLKCLHTLTKFVVGKRSGSSIRELGKLKNLQGRLSISKLQNVVPPKDALNAGLKDKKHLEKLALEWDATTPRSGSERIVLESLRPHTSLKSLTIKGYGGGIFPDWVGHCSFSNIASLHLSGCKNISSLPSFGQLRYLKELSIVGLDRVSTLGHEFCGNSSTCSSSIQPFGGLKVLRFEKMSGWQKWLSSSSAEKEGGAFPNLKELYIRYCPKLKGGLPIHIPSLAKLEIKSCPKLVASLLESQLRTMSENASIVLVELPTGKRKLEVKSVNEVASLERIMDNNSLQELQIYICDSLMSFPWGGQLLALKSVSIIKSPKLKLPIDTNYSALETLSLEESCESLSSFPLALFPKLKDLSIERCEVECLTVPQQHESDLVISKIQIVWCDKFVSFPQGELRNLTSLVVVDCESLTSLPDKMNQLLPSLITLRIDGCGQMKLFPEDGLPSNLNSLTIRHCDKLFDNRRRWGLQKLSSLTKLTIGGVAKGVKSFPESRLLPTGLIDLRIYDFRELKSLDKDEFQCLTSLQKLYLSECKKLEHMPEEGLPASLSLVKINVCPLLKRQWKRKRGKEWLKTAHVPNIMIDRKWIQKLSV
ncbi:putative disease resistance RPP13-like protein 1 [Morella rubra]|uniref:Putative disease resistance RPP13-like protein 1 n=1 Tax=Morella rubra TaxID=262757 RepID=A0A6A1UH35_9ROSI|nr:putative disease resistance RPP13-like protein 1 [Morella rubra]